MSLNNLDPKLVKSLPLDISRYILETAALLHRPTAMNLTLVSKTAHRWITPILYRTIVLASNHTLHSFAQCITRRDSPDFYHQNVKILCISQLLRVEDPTATSLSDVQLVLSTCTGIVSLSVWVRLPETLTDFFMSEKIVSHPKYMSFLHLPPNDISHVLPPSLTLLDIQLRDGDFTFSDTTWNTLFSLCPNLTTLVLSDDYMNVAEIPLFIAEMVSSILSSPRDFLQSIIVRPGDFDISYEALLERFEALDDSRIVIVPCWHIPYPEMASIERKYPGMVFFLPEVMESVTDEHQLADWTFPTPAPYVETLWERVERWKEEGRCPTMLEYNV